MPSITTNGSSPIWLTSCTLSTLLKSVSVVLPPARHCGRHMNNNIIVIEIHNNKPQHRCSLSQQSFHWTLPLWDLHGRCQRYLDWNQCLLWPCYCQHDRHILPYQVDQCWSDVVAVKDMLESYITKSQKCLRWSGKCTIHHLDPCPTAAYTTLIIEN